MFKPISFIILLSYIKNQLQMKNALRFHDSTEKWSLSTAV